MLLRPAGPDDAEPCARLHADSFPVGWPAADFAGYAAAERYIALVAAAADDTPCGVVVLACAGAEADILTLCVVPAARRQGVARALLADALARAVAAGIQRITLEVRADNAAAQRLYTGAGFVSVALRHAYSGGCDAHVMRLDLCRACEPRAHAL